MSAEEQNRGSERAVRVRGDITLGQLLKLADLVGSGGEGKLLISEGAVSVNGDVELRRGRKLRSGDVVELGDERVRVVEGDDAAAPGSAAERP